MFKPEGEVERDSDAKATRFACKGRPEVSRNWPWWDWSGQPCYFRAPVQALQESSIVFFAVCTCALSPFMRLIAAAIRVNGTEFLFTSRLNRLLRQNRPRADIDIELRHELFHRLALAQDSCRNFFSDHDSREVCIGAGNRRHYRSIANPKARHTIDTC